MKSDGERGAKREIPNPFERNQDTAGKESHIQAATAAVVRFPMRSATQNTGTQASAEKKQ